MSDFTSSTPDDQPPAVPNPAAAPPPQAPQAPMPPQAPQAPQAPQYQPPPGAVQYPQQPPAAPQYAQPPGAPPYGQQPAYAQGGVPVSPQGQPLADWGTRALGWLVDFVIILPVGIVAAIFLQVVPFLGYIFDLAALAVAILFAIQIGDTGQSPGMRLIGLKCIGLQTGETIGAGMGVVRAIACILNSIICYVGWLFPLWDAKRQTLADKIMTTEVIVVPKQGFSLFPPK